MFFLVRTAFWLTIVLALLPSGGAQNGAHAQVGAGEAVVAASAAVSDMSGFCDRQREACEVGAQAAVAIGQRAQAGAKMVYEFFSDRGETGSVVKVSAATRGSSGPSSQNTLTDSDLEAAWQAPSKQTENVPLPRKAPHRKA